MKRILFVDDEPNILAGLKRMLRPMRSEWDMTFAGSGQEALAIMEKQPVDIIVTDMRMPGMDGAAVLNEVMNRYPSTVRFILSGQSDKETILRSVGPAHQFIAKPCEAETLKATVDRASGLRDLLSNDNLTQLVSQMPSLPPRPELYTRLMEELQSPDCSVGAVGRIIESDVGMTAQILHWANSAFFGVRQNVSNPVQATSLLGLDTIRALVLMVGAFAHASESKFPPLFSFEVFCQHSMAVGAYAQAISKSQGVDDKEVNNAFTGGILHDAGRLVLAVNAPADYREVLRRIQEEHVPITQAEQDAFGCTHAAVGAYLLGLWGIPDSVVESVAFHHRPSDCLANAFGPLTAVHVANCLEYEGRPGGEEEVHLQLDAGYLAALGLDEKLSAWRQVCQEIGKGKDE